jgi:hypothetical protein
MPKLGRLKPCLHCARDFYCQKSKDVGGSLPEQKFCGRPCYVAYYNRPEYRESLFWAQVEKTPTCWLWTGWKLNSGYGETSLRGRKITVHRLSYIWAYGEIPKGKLVMHTCDTPLCVRPDHLRVGTDATNHDDMVAKRRHQHGERAFNAKLNESLVREIRAQKGKATIRELAARYGVSQPTIWHVMVGRTWRYVQ